MPKLAALLLVLTTTASADFAATPERAVSLVDRYRNGSLPVAIRVDRSGRYATVLLRGGSLENASTDGAPFLVERFAFGWQTLSWVDDSCALESRGISNAEATALLAGMPRPKAVDRRCADQRDVGPVADVAQVRLEMRGPLVPSVRVARDYALGEWYGAGGGQDLFHREHGRWQRVAGGGGAMDRAELERKGVPRDVVCRLIPYARGCPGFGGP